MNMIKLTEPMHGYVFVAWLAGKRHWTIAEMSTTQDGLDLRITGRQTGRSTTSRGLEEGLYRFVAELAREDRVKGEKVAGILVTAHFEIDNPVQDAT